IFDEQTIEEESTQQHRPKEAVKHAGLHLDEDIVFQIERQSAEHHHQDGGEKRHGRKPFLQKIAEAQGHRDRHHETGRGAENAEIAEGRKKDQQRAQIERQPPYLGVHAACPSLSRSAPTSARAKSVAMKGCKSSSPSPTPI